MMFIAKPNDMNFSNSQKFADMFEAQSYLEQVTGVNMPMDEWIILGKILEVNPYGDNVMPEFYPKVRKGNIVMERVDIESFL
jgi:hypothetical protein